MKISLIAFVILLSQSTFAQRIRPCTNEVLTCEMAGDVIHEVFEGLNEDEPSIEPDECNMNIWMEHNGTVMRMFLGDSHYALGIYVHQRPNVGTNELSRGVFYLKKNQPISFKYKYLQINCVLN